MKKNCFKKIILIFSHFILFSSLLSNYFFYNNEDKKNDHNGLFRIQYNILDGIYIDSESIILKVNNNVVDQIIFLDNLIGEIYQKGNKKPIKVIYNKGSIETIIKDKIVDKIEIEYQIFNQKDNLFIKKNELLMSIKKEIEDNKLEVIKEIKTEKIEQFSFFNNLIESASNSNFLIMALITFILGLLMSLTPCIYPMIPITISILGIDKKDFYSRFCAGLLYVFGISITFSILGMLAASGKLFFGNLLSSTIFTIIVTIVLFVMTLQMLGLIDSLFNFQSNFVLPNCIKNSRYLPFFYGIFSGTITSPCVSPGLFAILSLVSQQNNILIGWLWLFTFGIGLGLPLLLIAMVMNSAFIFPKSGQWMNELKESIGILLIFILNQNISRLVDKYISLFLICLLLIIFLINKYISFKAYKNIKKYWFCSFSVLCAIFAFCFLAWSNYYEYLDKQKKINIANKIDWQNDFEVAKKKAMNENKILFLDFTADWCSLCQIVYKEFFNNFEVIFGIKPYYVFCKIDCTNISPEYSALLKKYKINGFPTLLLIDPHSEDIIEQYSSDILDIKVSKFISQSKKLYEEYNAKI
jgi:thiol:disulfide interchange protein DsbD